MREFAHMDSKEVSSALHMLWVRIDPVSPSPPLPSVDSRWLWEQPSCAWYVLFPACLAPVASPSCCPCRSGEQTPSSSLSGASSGHLESVNCHCLFDRLVQSSWHRMEVLYVHTRASLFLRFHTGSAEELFIPRKGIVIQCI